MLLEKMIIPQISLEEHGAEIVGMFFFHDNVYFLLPENPIGEKLAMLSAKYRFFIMCCDYCGAKGISDVADKILHCIRTFSDAGCHVEVRTNIIPGANDQEENYRGIASWIRHNMGMTTPWHITRFFPANKLDHFIQTPAGSLLKAQQIGLDEGLKYVQTFFSKGCDCAKENCMVGSEREYRKATMQTCCK